MPALKEVVIDTQLIGTAFGPNQTKTSLLIAMVTHTDRDNVTRLISARAANSPEREAYRSFERELIGERTRGRRRERNGL